MPEMRNYKIDIEIDEGDLEGEWLVHPSLYMHYTGILAKATERKDNAKLKMEWIASNIDLDVRKNWSKKYGFDAKPNEGAIKSIIATNKKYLKACRNYFKCVKIVNSLTGVKTAFEHRKHSLSNLVSMQISGFHSEPRNKVKDLQKVINIGNHLKHKEELSAEMKKRKNRRFEEDV